MQKQIVNLLLSLVSIAYPLIWLFNSTSENSILKYLPLLMALLWLIKSYLQEGGLQRRFGFLMTVILIFVGLSRNLQIMYWYPVLMNVIMLILFGGSLYAEQSLVERLARLQTPNLSDRAVAYTKKVTYLWCIVFIINIIVSSGLVLSDNYYYWALYTGFISYILMAAVMGVEWCVRQFFMKKYQHYE